MSAFDKVNADFKRTALFADWQAISKSYPAVNDYYVFLLSTDISDIRV